MYSFLSLEPVCCSMSGSHCCFLPCIQISQEAGTGIVVCSLVFPSLEEFSTVCCDPHKGFSIVNETDVFLKFSCLFCHPTDAGNLIAGSSAYSKPSLYIWKFSVHILLKPSLKDFEHYFASMWNECSYVIVSAFIGIAFLWDWNENWPFPVLWLLLHFPNLLAYWMYYFNSIIF